MPPATDGVDRVVGKQRDAIGVQITDTSNKPVIFLAFANDRDDNVGYLRNLPDEARRLRDVLQPAAQAGLCEVVVRSNSTAGDMFKVLQDPKYRNRIAILHYGGHANGYELLLESAAGEAAAADAGGLALFLAEQQGLQLVFLNGCSTQQQTEGLLDANIPAVISTSRSIDDQVATDFAHQFYQGLAGGASVRTAYNEAEASVQTAKGGNTRALYFGDRDESQRRFEADRRPWNLYLREGSEAADQWNLPDAVNNPLFGLPPLPEQDLPESPYRHLNWFTRSDAEVFFGRGHQVRELYDRLTAPRTAPILLFYGQSGVGKSSILDAGLIPRLEQDYEVRYLRRTESGLLATLRSAFSPDDSHTPVETAWRQTEARAGKPLIVFLDQVEELYTRPIAGMPDELEQLLSVLKATFNDPHTRPQGKLVLGFRKEWLAELETQLIDYELPRSKVFLEPLDRRGIVEVVRGPARSERLRERYGLSVEDGLAEIIADDLLEDRDSAIAPTLQILLTKLWTKATEENYEQPNFSQALYQQLKRDGILLRDFLNQQIATFRERYPEAVESGLLLDIVALHTTALGTAGQCTLEELQQQYSHLGASLPDLLQQCQDLHLLTVAASTRKDSKKTTRLAHDTLAPLVRERFDESDKPGQRARRILDNRSVDWAREQVGTPLDEADLAIVEQGAKGTRALSARERRLLDASRDLRTKLHRNRRILKISGVAVALVIAMLGAFGWWQADEAISQKHAALIQVGNANWQRAVSARDYGHNAVRAAHLFAAAAGAFAGAEEPGRAANSLTAIDDGIVAAFPHNSTVMGAMFNGDESRVLSWSDDGALRLWDPTKGESPKTIQHDDPVRGASFSNEKSRLLTWSEDGALRLWDTTTDRPLRTFQHSSSVRGALFNSDDSRLLSWSKDGTLRLWDTTKDKPLRTFRHGGHATGALFSGDGSRVVSWGHGTTLQLWGTGDDEPLRTFQQRRVVGAMFNNDESLLLTWSLDGQLDLWDPTQDEPHRSFQDGGNYRGASFNGDGSRIVSWGYDGTVRLWDPEKREPLKFFQHDNVLGASFNGDGSRLVSWGYDGTVRLWNPEEDESLRTIQHGSFVKGALFNGNGSRLLSWSTDSMVRLWDTTRDEPQRAFKHDNVVHGALFNNDRSQLVSWDDEGTIRLWRPEKDEALKVFQHSGSVEGVLFNDDGSLLLSWSDDETVRLWDIREEEPLRTFQHDDRVRGALFNGDESRVVTWGSGTTLRLWDVAKDEPLRTFRHDDSVTGAKFNPDGSRLLSVDVDGTMLLWDIGKDEPLRAFKHESPVNGGLFNGDSSRLLSWSTGGMVRLWDIAKEEPLRTFDHDNVVVHGALFNSDESRIVSWARDGTIRLWSPEKDEPLRELQHDDAIRGALFNDDGSRLLSWSKDGVARLWDIDEDKPLRTFKHDRVFDAMFNNDESQVLSVGSDGTMKLWDPTQSQPLRIFQHYSSVMGASFNGDAVLSWGGDGVVRLWEFPKFDDVSINTIDDITLELEARTAETITEQGVHQLLTFEEWKGRQRQLSELQGQ